MKRFYIPTTNADDWRKLLADPVKQWRTGFSARALAYCWESAQGWPPEIKQIFNQSDMSAFRQIDLILAIPEYQVPMPPYRGHPSQNDLFVLAKAADGQLITGMVEGKVGEPFGQTLQEWQVNQSPGKAQRLAFIRQQLGLVGELPVHIRYQLLHRLTSAVIEAGRFNARSAVMIVHSFSPGLAWFEDYQAFLELFEVHNAVPDHLYYLKEVNGLKLYSGWAKGEEQFLDL